MATPPGPKPSLPENYVVPAIWTPPSAAHFGGMNRPTADPRHNRPLQRGSHPLQLYCLGTPNGIKVTILLEELGVDYDAWHISIMGADGDQFGAEFTAVNPNQKIPALLDYSDPAKPLRVFESGSILLYLADKYKKFIPQDPRARVECINWLFWNIGTAPFIGGGFGHFYYYAPIKIEYAIDRYAMEVKRELDVLNKHLAGKNYICGDEYTIADMAIAPWITAIDTGYHAKEFLQLDSYENVRQWRERVWSRDAVKRGIRVNNTWSPDGLKERHSRADFDKPIAAKP